MRFIKRIKTSISNIKAKKQKVIKKKNPNVETAQERYNRTSKEVQEIYKSSTGLQLISKTLRAKAGQEQCKKVFLEVKKGIEKKYKLRFEFVDFGVVQRLTQVVGNYSTYLEKTTQ